jgi:hypothetical protein
MFTRSLLATVLLCFTASGALAESASCHARAAEKKLAGAAKTSFLGKCEKDAVAACTAAAGDKKIFGAARNSFTNKCVRDAVGVEPDKPA